MPIRLIAMDMDGTLLNDYGKIPQENVEALRKAMDAGVVVSVNSGRYAENARIVMDMNGIRCPVIGTNGAKILGADGKCLSLHPIRTDASQRIRDFLDTQDCLYYMYGSDFLTASKDGRRHHSEVQYGENLIADYGFHYYHGKAEIKAVSGEPILKFYICENQDLPALRQKLEQFTGVIITSSGSGNIEISPEGVDKASGLKELASLYGISLSDTAAFGDQENDLPALTAAGWGFAMGNASQEVLRSAPYQTLSNNLCGIARAIDKYIFA